MAEITSWYGLSFIKGGFVAQLAYGVVGCLDTRNQAAYGIGKRDFRELPANASVGWRLRHARRYCRMCRKLGGAAVLWDAWCDEYQHSKVAARLSTGWLASAEHCRILGLPTGDDPLAGVDDIPF